MYLRKVTYQLGLRVKSLGPCFHKSHLENLALLVIGIAYSRSVSLPKAAGAVPYKRIQVESLSFSRGNTNQLFHLPCLCNMTLRYYNSRGVSQSQSTRIAE